MQLKKKRRKTAASLRPAAAPSCGKEYVLQLCSKFTSLEKMPERKVAQTTKGTEREVVEQR